MCWIAGSRCELCAPTKARRIDLILCSDGSGGVGYRQCDTC